jgi:flavodoxin
MLLAVFLTLPVAVAAQDAQPAVEPIVMKDSTLLVYSSGEPFMTITDIKDPGLLDAISSPTPRERNTAQVAMMIRDCLARSGANIRMVKAEELDKEDWRSVIAYRTVILGSPARHWNVSWEMKRFIDLIMGRIYVHPDRAANTQFALFTTAEIHDSAEDCLEMMAKVVRDCKAPVVARLNTHHQQSQEEFQAAVDKFCNVLKILAH